MTMKSSKRKQKQLNSATRINKYKITFNYQQFNLGERKIKIDNTKQEFRKVILQLYKTKRLPIILYKRRQNSKFKQQIQLSNYQIMQIVRDRIKDSHQNIISNINRIYRNLQLTKQKYRENQSSTKLLHTKKVKNIFETYRDKANKHLQLNRQSKLEKQQKMRSYLQKAIIKIQRQIFVNSIVLLIEKQSLNKNKFQQDIEVTIVLEQCFPNIDYPKSKLIKLIGVQKYNQLRSKTIKTYFKQNKSTNQLFLACHHCMKVLSNVQRQAIACKAKSKEEMIESHILSDPYQFYHKIILKDHFEYTFQSEYFKDKRVKLPYFQYFDKVEQQGETFFKCNRVLCLECFLFNQKNKKIIEKQEQYFCNHCIGNCNCIRCSLQEKLVKLMGYYLNLKGDLNNLVKKIILNQNSFKNTDSLRKINDKSFLNKQALIRMVQFCPNDQSQNHQYPTKTISNTQNVEQTSALFFGLAKKKMKSIEEFQNIKNKKKSIKLKKKQKENMAMRQKIQKAGITSQEAYECYQKDQQQLIKKIKNSSQHIFLQKLPIFYKGKKQLIRPESFIRKNQRSLINFPNYFHTNFGRINPEIMSKKQMKKINAQTHKNNQKCMYNQKKQVPKNSFGSIWDDQSQNA